LSLVFSILQPGKPIIRAGILDLARQTSMFSEI